MAEKMFGSLIKGVVDVEKNILALDAEMHVDEESELLKQGSNQQNLWGINLYPELFRTPDFIEFDSMINIRPSVGNRTRGVEDKKIQDKIRRTVEKLVVE